LTEHFRKDNRLRFKVYQEYLINKPILKHYCTLLKIGKVETHSNHNHFVYVVNVVKNCSKVINYFDNVPFKIRNFERNLNCK